MYTITPTGRRLRAGTITLVTSAFLAAMALGVTADQLRGANATITQVRASEQQTAAELSRTRQDLVKARQDLANATSARQRSDERFATAQKVMKDLVTCVGHLAGAGGSLTMGSRDAALAELNVAQPICDRGLKGQRSLAEETP